MSGIDEILNQHADPFVLNTDVCLQCKQAMTTQRISCPHCLGHADYCSEDCLWKHGVKHTSDCFKFMRKFIPVRHEYMRRQHRMFGPSRGYPELLQYAMTNIEYNVLRENLFFIRLPLDTTTKFLTTHPIKKIPRQGCAKIMTQALVFRRAWKAYVEHAAKTPIEHFYFFCYSPNLSVVVMTAVPYQPQATSSEMPHMQVLPCPCKLHTASSA